MLIPEQKTHNIIKCLENIIISLYAKGMIVSDIDEKVKELYDFEISSSAISIITNAVATEMVSCQNRPLEDLYLIGIVFDVRENSKVINKTHLFGSRIRSESKITTRMLSKN
ncbi:hypothetical protein GCM10022217_11430 [Chryseobacterium ginsenosidimutans]